MAKKKESKKDEQNEKIDVYGTREHDGKVYSGNRYMLRPESGMTGAGAIHTPQEWSDLFGHTVIDDDGKVNKHFKDV